MNKIAWAKIKSKKLKPSGTIMMMTLLILSSILVVTLAAADLVFAGLRMNRLTGYSGLAFYASEAGMERALWEARKNNYTYPDQDTLNVFNLSNLGNNSSYQVDYSTSSPNVTFKAIGAYGGVKRSVEGTYSLSGGTGCLPNCTGKVCGSDGCSGSCGTCAINYSCIDGACVVNPPTAPTNLALSQTANNKSFSVSWTAGTNNGGAGGCKIQYLQSGSTWTDITSATSVNCDATVSGAAYTLNADGWKASWGGTQVRLFRISDAAAVATFPQTLACASLAASPTATPSIDEDCNGSWDNYTTYSCNCYQGPNCIQQGTQDISYWGYAPNTNCAGTAYTGYIVYGCISYYDPSCYTNQSQPSICGNTYGSIPCDWKIMPMGTCCFQYEQICSTCYNYY